MCVSGDTLMFIVSTTTTVSIITLYTGIFISSQTSTPSFAGLSLVSY